MNTEFMDINALPFPKPIISNAAFGGTQPAFQLRGTARRAFYGPLADEQVRAILLDLPVGTFICRSRLNDPFAVGVSWKSAPNDISTTWFDRRPEPPLNTLPAANLPHLLLELGDPLDNLAILRLFTTIKGLPGYWEFGTSREAVEDLEKAGTGFFVIKDHFWDANSVMIYYNNGGRVTPFPACPSGVGDVWEVALGVGLGFVALPHLSQINRLFIDAKPLPPSNR